jgi:lysophospholipase L1-like esterase
MRSLKYNSIPQLGAVMAGFALTIVLLESEALLTWAQRLEVGFGREEAVQATSLLHKALQPLGIEKLRQQGLTSLDRLGWSDDPARLNAARNGDTASSINLTRPCQAMNKAGRPLALGATIAGGRTAAPVPGVGIPVILSVPKATALLPLPAAVAGKPRVVALVGDSMMAVGLSNVLLRETAATENLRVLKAFRSGTGLARPDVFDWMKEYPAMIGDQRPDVIFVAIGANDGQGFVENGEVLPFGSDAWVKAYQQRTATFLSLLTEHGARVVWVGLPPMKSAKYDDKTAAINRIAYTVVSQYPQASWWNPLPYIADDAGGYREFATLANGKTVRIRAVDGIHLSDEGAALLVPTLIGWLNPPAPVAPVKLIASK